MAECAISLCCRCVDESTAAAARNAQSKRLGRSDNSVLLRCIGFCDEGAAPGERGAHKGGLWTTNAIQFIGYVGLCPSLCLVPHCSLLDSPDRLFNSPSPRFFFPPSTRSAECYPWYPIENMKNDPSPYRIYDATLTHYQGVSVGGGVNIGSPAWNFVHLPPFVSVPTVRAVISFRG